MIQLLPALLLTFPLLAALLIRLIPQRWSRAAAGSGALLLLMFYLFLASLPLDFSSAATVEWGLWGQVWLATEGTWAILRLLYLGTLFLFLFAMLWPASMSPAGGPVLPSPPAVEFIAAGLAVLAPLTAALLLPATLGAAALFLATVPVIMMLRPGANPASGRAALRYFLLTALALPFFLLAGWMVQSEQLVFAGVAWRLLLVGLALLLAGFPFHTWVRDLVAGAPPLLLPFLFVLVHLVLLLFGIRLLQENPLLAGNRQLYPLMRWLGVGTALVGALLAWKTPSRDRLLGALLLLDLGSAIVALSLGNQALRPVLLLLSGRFISLLLVLSGLSLLRHPVPSGDGTPPGLGFSRATWATLLFIYGSLSLLGLPLTPGFPGRWALLSLVATRSLWPTVILLLALAGGTAGLVFHLRSSGAASAGERQELPFPPVAISFVLLIAALLLALFPSPMISFATDLARLLG